MLHITTNYTLQMLREGGGGRRGGGGGGGGS